MVVFSERRGKGVGTRMFEVAKEQARHSGCGQVSLLAFERNGGRSSSTGAAASR
ncbi:MAG: GNAT family N-acetyltransferase [Pyrinomonadaceae bacterium]|nr:GNAT family N-acetyltransferase [Pyrinomonadaceae bacterium]